MATEAQTPLLDTLEAMIADSLERNKLDAQQLMMVRIAALVAVDAPSLSYLMNLGVAKDMGVSADQVEAVLIGIAPIVGTPRIVAAAQHIAQALGIAISIAEEDLARAEKG